MADEPAAERLRCTAVVYKRDTYRRTGRTKFGFEMHYIKAQCSRRATCGAGLCRQHAMITGVEMPRGG